MARLKGMAPGESPIGTEDLGAGAWGEQLVPNERVAQVSALVPDKSQPSGWAVAPAKWYLVSVAWEMGMTVRQIAQDVFEAAMSEQGIRNILKENGYGPRRKPVTDEEKREWARLWREEDMTGYQIAAIAQRDRTVVMRALREQGIDLSGTRGRRRKKVEG